MLAILGIIYTALVCVPTVAILGSEKKYPKARSRWALSWAEKWIAIGVVMFMLFMILWAAVTTIF